VFDPGEGITSAGYRRLGVARLFFFALQRSRNFVHITLLDMTMVQDIPAKAKWTGLQLARIGPLVRFDLVRSENLPIRLTIGMRRPTPFLQAERPSAASLA
jgi:hypothetical protein